MGQSKRLSIVEVIVLKSISFILASIFIGSIKTASIYVLLTTVIYYFVRRFFNWLQLRNYKKGSPK